MPTEIREFKNFEVVSSLEEYDIVEAFAGISDSFFKTSEGRVLSCGSNRHAELMIKKASQKNVYQPTETIVYAGIEPPKNSPNRKISEFNKASIPPKSCKKVSKDELAEINELRQLLKSTKDENSALKEENSALKKENSALKEENSALKKENSALKEENSKLNQENSKIQDEVSALNNENSILKEELGQSEKQIKELEKKVNELKEKMTFKSKDPKESENKKDKALDIINPETLDKMRRIKSLGRGAASEVFEVAREERLALKVHYQELVSEVTDDDDDEEEERLSPILRKCDNSFANTKA